MNKLLLLLPLAALLAACGGSNGDTSASASTTNTTPQATTPTDAFTSNVAVIAGAQSDTTEPMAIDAITASSPDESEPSPLS